MNHQTAAHAALVALVLLAAPPAARASSTKETHDPLGLTAISTATARALQIQLKDLFASEASRTRYLGPVVFSLFDTVSWMSELYARDVSHVSSRFSVLRTNLGIADARLPYAPYGQADEPELSAAHAFCRETIADVDPVIARLTEAADHAFSASSDVGALSHGLLASDPAETRALRMLDDLEGALDRRDALEPLIRRLFIDVEGRLQSVGRDTLFRVPEANDPRNCRYSQQGFVTSCEPLEDVGTQTERAIFEAFDTVDDDPWLRVNVERQDGVFYAQPTLRRMRNVVGGLYALVSTDFTPSGRRIGAALQDAWHHFNDAERHVYDVEYAAWTGVPADPAQRVLQAGSERSPLRSQGVIEAARSLTRGIGSLVAALREVERLLPAARTITRLNVLGK